MYDSILKRVNFLLTVKPNEKISLTRLKKYSNLNWYQRIADGESRHILILDLERLNEEINLYIQVESEKHQSDIKKLIELKKLISKSKNNLVYLKSTYSDPDFTQKIRLIIAKVNQTIVELENTINQIINYELPFDLQNVDKLNDKKLKTQAISFFKKALEKMNHFELIKINKKMYKMINDK
jgi:hypothetical protein